MIQFNLLPDIKLQYMKTKRTKKLVLFSAVGAGGLALGIFILLFVVVNVVQRQHLGNLNEDIKKHSEQLQNQPDITKILTVQSQLRSLPGLHNAKPATTRLNGYLEQVVPAEVSVAKLDLDYEATLLSFSGSANSLNTVNKFIDTLKFTEYEENEVRTRAFTSVVLSSYGLSDEGVVYQIDLKFDPVIFDQNRSVKLVVPSIVTSRSETEKPVDLFQEAPNQETQ